MKKYWYTVLLLFIGALIISGFVIVLSISIVEDETKEIAIPSFATITFTLVIIGAMIYPKQIIKKQNLKKLNLFLDNLHIDSESMFERVAYYFLNNKIEDILKINCLSSQVLPNIYEYGGIDLTVKIVRVNLDNILLTFSKDSFSVYIFDIELKDKLYKDFFNNDFTSHEEIILKINELCNEIN